MRRIRFNPVAALSAGVLLAFAGAGHAADGERLLTAARIHTSDPGTPSATAMVWGADGRIIAVGGAAELAARHPDAQRIDVGHATVIPGLIDAHVHLVGLGHALMQADLVGARSTGEIVERLQAFAQSLPGDAWLIGRGWDQNLWPDKAFPTAAVLDAAFPDRPVVLERIDGHAAWANSAAMRAVGRDLAGDWQPEGGLVLRADGRATGVFIDTAASLVYDVVPEPDAAWQDRAMERALRHVASLGLTGVHDMGTSRSEFDVMRRFADRGALTLRVRAYALGDSDLVADRCRDGAYRHASGRLDMRGVKLMVDGALGSRGAALIDDYSDDPGNRGLVLLTEEALEAAVRRARDCGLQVATHAIGDRGNRIVLDAYRRVLGEAAAGDHRWRVEHAQVLAPGHLERFAALRLVASVQPTHATSDMPWAGERLGEERLAGAYAWRSFVQAGVPLALGSDFPVELPDPRLGLHAAVTRQDVDGHPPGGWRVDQALTAAEALHGFTAGAAWAAFDEGETGRLVPGLRADFVVVAEDPLQIAGSGLDTLGVLSTWVDGRPVHEAASPAGVAASR
ncbi:amidohydrolase [Luteimonas sp. MC1825]|uniref:amidohydrolase n=1 Tax=Luteimonas sp. MC1825 TaxID=2761107 RepID=UPI00160CE89C|nr:amidohydrolase [Luteimonas sp. MC1825]MBB6598630.1 amidohydrolase [Luteimonas sp. MC1825]QOC88805.1 amidohydrolase [Luteimonas sp. MC1825]